MNNVWINVLPWKIVEEVIKRVFYRVYIKSQPSIPLIININKAFTYDRYNRDNANCWPKRKTGTLNMLNEGYTSGARCNYAKIPDKKPSGKYPEEGKV